MILVRDVFQLRFGKAREAIAVWQDGLDMMRRKGTSNDVRLLTDVVGPYYTLVLETTYDSMTGLQDALQGIAGDAEWHAWYQRFVPLVESGHREVFSIVGTTVPSLPTAEAQGRRTMGGT